MPWEWVALGSLKGHLLATESFFQFLWWKSWGTEQFCAWGHGANNQQRWEQNKELQTFRRVFQPRKHFSCRKPRKVWSFHLVPNPCSPWPPYSRVALLQHTLSIHTSLFRCRFYHLLFPHVNWGLGLCSTQLPPALSTCSGARWCR